MTGDEAPIYREVGLRIRQARQRCGMSQQHLARLVGCVYVHISHIESGQRRVSLAMFLSIADALDIDWADLLANPEAQP